MTNESLITRIKNILPHIIEELEPIEAQLELMHNIADSEDLSFSLKYAKDCITAAADKLSEIVG